MDTKSKECFLNFPKSNKWKRTPLSFVRLPRQCAVPDHPDYRKQCGDKPDELHPFRERHFTKHGEETIAVRVNWKKYTNKELGECFERFLSEIRPDQFPEPRRAGKGKKTSLQSALDGLSAMRLISNFKPDEAIKKFNLISLAGDKAVNDEKKVRAKARAAIKDFNKYFPWELRPENGLTFKQRNRLANNG